MYFHRGYEWYMSCYGAPLEDQRLFDPTPDYLRSPVAASRIASDNPDARIIVCLREPIERAFSHYWHERKKHRFNFNFEEVLNNYDLFMNWIEPGFYSTHLKRFREHFPGDQIHAVLFDDLQADPHAFIRDLYAFAGVRSDFSPTVLRTRVNSATSAVPRDAVYRTRGKQILKDLGLYDFVRRTRNALAKGGRASTRGSGEIPNVGDVDPGVTTELVNLLECEYASLETLLGRNLDGWRGRYGQQGGST